MKKRIMIMMILLITLVGNVKAQLAQDKVLHVVVPATITEVTYLSANLIWKDNGTSFRAAFGLNTCIVTYKELFDAFNGGRFSNEDWLYGFTSGFIVAGINYLAHKTLQPRKKRRHRVYNPDLIP